MWRKKNLDYSNYNKKKKEKKHRLKYLESLKKTKIIKKNKIIEKKRENLKYLESLKKKNKNKCACILQRVFKKFFLIKKSSKTNYLIINNNLCGGSNKWQKDFEKVQSLIRIYKLQHLYVILKNHKNPKSIVLLINSFIRTTITYDDIIILYKIFGFNIILPIHDFGWFTQDKIYTKKWHNIYLHKEVELDNVKKFFDIVKKIICPSKFVRDIYYNLYPSDKIEICEWIDYDLSNNSNNKYKIIAEENQINIGIMNFLNECKGIEQINYLRSTFNYWKNLKIRFFFVGQNMDIYEDNYESFIHLIKKHNIQGLLYLNKWGETWGYTLTKGLISGLPILYNNIGSFIERVPKNESKYIINNNNEIQYYNKDLLADNFGKLINYITSNDIFINNNTQSLNIIDKFANCFLFKEKKMKKYAVYFPQFHKIKENDINFYENYTDIVNLNMLKIDKKETPNNKLLSLNNILDYDLTKNEQLIDKQIDFLHKYNIDGFAMYYYWFSKNTITNKNTIMYNIHEKFLFHYKNLNGKKIFYIWANENWSDNPAFGDSGHIIKNEYTEENFIDQSNFLVNAFLCNNYLKINNKPVFYLHQPWFISQDLIKKFTKILNDKCIEYGFDGIELKLNNMNKTYKNGYNFHPNYKKTKTIKTINNKNILDYKEYVKNDVKLNVNVNTIFFDFDNRARLFKPDRLNHATICVNNTEETFIEYLKKIKYSNTEILLINAWNEWGEKMHIEPSEEKGDYYLKLINKYI